MTEGVSAALMPATVNKSNNCKPNRKTHGQRVELENTFIYGMLIEAKIQEKKNVRQLFDIVCSIDDSIQSLD